MLLLSNGTNGKYEVSSLCAINAILLFVCSRLMAGILAWRFPAYIDELSISAWVCWGAVSILCCLLQHTRKRLRLYVVVSGICMVVLFSAQYQIRKYYFPELNDCLSGVDGVSGYIMSDSKAGLCFEVLDSYLDYLPDSEMAVASAQMIMNNMLKLYDYDIYKIPYDLKWNENPPGDPSWNWRLNCLVMVGVLLRAYEITKDYKYLDRAKVLVLDWIDDNYPIWGLPPSEFSWYDHSVVFRMAVLVYFSEVWKRSDACNSTELEVVYRSIFGHARRLASSYTYTKHSNHGTDQDLMLAYFCVRFPECNMADEWLDVAVNRFEEQSQYVISPENIHMEHSPSYHLYGMTQQTRMLQLLQASSIVPEYQEKIRTRIQGMAEFVPMILRPDNCLAEVGDTQFESLEKYSTLLELWSSQIPALESLLESGDRNDDFSGFWVYPQTGYAFLRSTCGNELDYRHSFYLMVEAAAHPGRVHWQADDLSITLYALGQEVLVDNGYLWYKQDAGREFVKSVAAHNTVMVDRSSYSKRDVCIDSTWSEDGTSIIVAHHDNYPGIRHTRVVVFEAPSMVFVFDRLTPLQTTSDCDHHFDLLFNLSPLLKPSLENEGRIASVPIGTNDCSACFYLLSADIDGFKLVVGERCPMLGWHTEAHGRLVPAPTILASTEGSSAYFQTLIWIPCESSNPISFTEAVVKSRRIEQKFAF